MGRARAAVFSLWERVPRRTRCRTGASACRWTCAARRQRAVRWLDVDGERGARRRATRARELATVARARRSRPSRRCAAGSARGPDARHGGTSDRGYRTRAHGRDARRRPWERWGGDAGTCGSRARGARRARAPRHARRTARRRAGVAARARRRRRAVRGGVASRAARASSQCAARRRRPRARERDDLVGLAPGRHGLHVTRAPPRGLALASACEHYAPRAATTADRSGDARPGAATAATSATA